MPSAGAQGFAAAAGLQDFGAAEHGFAAAQGFAAAGAHAVGAGALEAAQGFVSATAAPDSITPATAATANSCVDFFFMRKHLRIS